MWSLFLSNLCQSNEVKTASLLSFLSTLFISSRKRRAADWQHFSTAAGLAVRGIHWLGGVRAVSH
ncbi:hypothetical protein BTM22_13850 [Vibrio parahaemolyticus]|nr:hypothetical protein BTM22_13850 [Vibrio parahaemolyticus]